MSKVLTETNNVIAQSAKDVFGALLKKALREKENMKELSAKLQLAKKDTSETLKELKKHLEPKQSSFAYNGKYYQIRSRSGTSYICESDVPFGSWKKKKND